MQPLQSHAVTFCGDCPWVCSLADLDKNLTTPYCRLDEQGREVSKTGVMPLTTPRWCPLRKGPQVVHLTTRKRLGSSAGTPE